jgi:hypothetical protein
MVADGGGREPTWDDKSSGNAGGGRPIPGEPDAWKLARPVRRGGRGNTVRLCALPLPYGDTGEGCGEATPPRSPRHGRCYGETELPNPRHPISMDTPTMARRCGNEAGTEMYICSCPATAVDFAGEREPSGPYIPRGEFQTRYAGRRGLKGTCGSTKLAT